jgi:hypothetical protein
MAEVASMMGHSDWEVTKKYAHLSTASFDTVRQALTEHRQIARRIAPEDQERLRSAGSRLREQAG